MRRLLRLVALPASASLVLSMHAFARAQDEVPLVLTPTQAEGPYYPLDIPLDHDADLTLIEGSVEMAAGTPLVLEGVLLQADGSALEGATVQIWQTDAYGVYLHPADPGYADRDLAFQGYGESVTDAEGAWAFRTILPEVYGGRPRHIHAKVVAGDETVLTTQVYFSGGDIPAEGAVEPTGTEIDALLVAPLLQTDEDGLQTLTARHRLVVP